MHSERERMVAHIASSQLLFLCFMRSSHVNRRDCAALKQIEIISAQSNKIYIACALIYSAAA
jgi:hypothetical protein